MKLFIGIRNALIPSLLLWVFILYGCAGFGKFTPSGAEYATNAVAVATGLLHVLDKTYGGLLALKLVPDYTVEATRALAIADLAAVFLRQVIAGATVTDEQLNVAAGQVTGAQAILDRASK